MSLDSFSKCGDSMYGESTVPARTATSLELAWNDDISMIDRCACVCVSACVCVCVCVCCVCVLLERTHRERERERERETLSMIILIPHSSSIDIENERNMLRLQDHVERCCEKSDAGYFRRRSAEMTTGKIMQALIAAKKRCR